MPVSIVLVNTAKAAEARQIGRTLVESGLAASANVVGGVASVYRWRGAVREIDEAQLILKTRSDLVGKVMARLRELHSYDCPAILVLPVADGDPDYLAWIERETGGA